jgi:hypothetical protein
MGKKHEALVQPRLFYVFVDLEPATPASFVVPSDVVADVLSQSHSHWLAAPGKNGRAHEDHDIGASPAFPRPRMEVGEGRTAGPGLTAAGTSGTPRTFRSSLRPPGRCAPFDERGAQR